MQIGDFARLCDTKISVLRHYDRVGLLKPTYTDRLTGYRYYSEKQKNRFDRITVLKEAGFSLADVKIILESDCTGDTVLRLLQDRRTELNEMLQKLDEAKNLILGEFSMNNYDDWVKFEDDIRMPFVNDPDVIGKWAVEGLYETMSDYVSGKNPNSDFYGDRVKEIYFLPRGEKYWVYGWTKGKLLIDEYRSTRAEDYEIEEIDGEKVMFVAHKSYQYLVCGKTELLVLKKLDSREYTPADIARKDKIDFPFVSDPEVLGRWRACGFLGDKAEFSTEDVPIDTLYWKSVEFFANGTCTSVYEDDVIVGDDQQTWTKNYLLRKYNHCACEYEIRHANGKDYLIIEWKSGDYRYGGFPTNYYVFTRE